MKLPSIVHLLVDSVALVLFPLISRSCRIRLVGISTNSVCIGLNTVSHVFADGDRRSISRENRFCANSAQYATSAARSSSRISSTSLRSASLRWSRFDSMKKAFTISS